MMDYYNTYKDLLRLDSSKSTRDIMISNNKEIIAEQFSNSPITEIAVIDNVEYEVMFKQEKKSEDKKIIFKPDTKINIGSVIIINANTYLAIDFLGEGIHEIYPTAKLKLCNTSLSLTGEPTLVDTGEKDWRDDPIYEETPGEPIPLPCIVESKIYYNQTTEAINLPDGHLQVTIPFTEHKDIALNGVIQVYGENYKIVEVDRTQSLNKTGILVISAKRE